VATNGLASFRRSNLDEVVRISGSASGAAYYVDFSPVIADIKRVLSTASEEIQRNATYNALNAVGGPLLTHVRRDIAKQTSAPYGRVMSRVWADKAHPNKLAYVIHAEDTAMPLKDFMKGGKPGDKKFTVKVWGKQKTYKKNVFVMDFGRGPTPVKRVEKHQTPGKGKLGAKALWGPIIPREMLRADTPSMRTLLEVVPYKLLPRLEHEIAQAFGRACKASGEFVGPMRNRGVDKRYFDRYQTK
jgi:hypothetical protein